MEEMNYLADIVNMCTKIKKKSSHLNQKKLNPELESNSLEMKTFFMKKSMLILWI